MSVNSLDKEAIINSFNVILTTTDESHRKQAGKFLSEIEQTNPLLIVALIEIFENE